MKFSILGAGVWMRGCESFADLVALGAGEPPADVPFTAPKPESIPPRERRRAGKMITMAVQVAHEACANAGVDVASVPSVFTSAMSDTVITDYMCEKLAGDEKLLSPTKFHNSVHNAASGYWSISAHNRTPSTYVCGFVDSAGSALFEAISQAVAHGGPVLLVGYELATESPFDQLVPIAENAAVALVVSPDHSDDGASFDLSVAASESESNKPVNEGLARRLAGHPMLPLVTLAESLALHAVRDLTIRMSPHAAVRLEAVE